MNKPKNNPPTQKEHRMSKWQNIRLGDIADFSNGINFDKSSYCENGTYLIGVSDFGEELFPDYSTLRHIDSTIVRECNLLKDGDIVFVRSNGNKALVGRSMLIKNPPENTSFSGFCIRARIKNHESFDPLFFAYLFKSENFRKAIAGCSIGANIQNLSQGKLASYMAYVPSIEIQRKIADVLSAYDDLIENNRKQIKLLEEAAQRLYKEWFIDLRFPGHETTPIIDGIPEGWEKKKLENICPIVTGKRDANFGSPDGEYLFFTCSQEPIKSATYSFDTSAVILAGNGDFNVKLYRGKFEAYQRTYVLSPQSAESLFLLFGAVRTNMRELTQKASGSTIKFLTRGMIANIEILVPHYSLLTQYNNMNNAIQTKIEKLKKSVQSAIEIRNRLLPKLMTGELEV